MKKIFSIVLSICVLVSLTAGLDYSVFAEDLQSSGKCGENVSYTFDSEAGTLTISGSGATENYPWGGSPFYNQSSIKSVVINDGVTNIGVWMFSDCRSLSSIEIPDSVISIGEYAFSHCSSLTTIEIPDSVTSIGVFAFEYCSSLTSIEIPDNVTSIDEGAFYYCSSLTSIKLPNSLTNIGDWLFNDCSELSGIEIPNSVTSIGRAAFSDCSSLTSIEIPDSVTSIGNSAFAHCSSLTSIKLPNSLTNIGDWMFSDCSELSSIEIPDNVISIGEYAFFSCNSLASIEIPNSVASIGRFAFEYCDGLRRIVVDSENTVYDSRENCNAIIETSGDKMIWACLNTNIPNTVKSIECQLYYYELFYDYGDTDAHFTAISYRGSQEEWSKVIEASNNFDNDVRILFCPLSLQGSCGENLEYSYTCSDGVGVLTISGTGDMTNYTNAESSPFYNLCIDYLIVEEGVSSIGDNAFSGSSEIKSISLPNSITTIGYGAFIRCRNLKCVEIPDGVTYIGNGAFYWCSGLEKIIIGKNVNKLGDGEEAFKGCVSLKSITVDNENKVYDSRENCNAIIETSKHRLILGCKNTKIPDTVTKIGDCAFENCISLKSIDIPNSITDIEGYAFNACKDLTSVDIPKYVTKIEYGTFSNCTALTSAEIPNSVICIDNGAFYNCRNLTCIEIPNSVTSIGDYAFQCCSELRSIEIPNSVTSIGSYAFYDCNKLEKVNINSIEKWCNIRFDGEYSNPLCFAHRLYLNNELVEKVVFPTGLSSINDFSFYNCTSLTSIEIPNDLTSIGEYAFYGCSGLSEITVDLENPVYDSRNNCNAIIHTSSKTLMLGCKNTVIPNGVTKIGALAFSYCTDLEHIDIPDSVISIGKDAFSYCSGLKSIDIANSVANIGENAFSFCTSLTSVKLPNKINIIEDGAFLKCENLISIEIPNTVTTIGYGAFSSCSSLNDVYYTGSETEWYSIKIWNDGEFGGNECLFKINIHFNSHMPCEIHIPAKAVIENEVAPTYDKAGSYDEVVYCSVCNKELSRTKKSNAKLKKTSISNASVSGIKDKTYTGKEITQSIMVKLGDKTLKNGTDYKVSYKNNKSVGKATLTVTGINAYSGTVLKTFKINPKGTSLSSITAKSKGFTVKWKKQATQTTGYQIQYATDIKFEKNKKTVSVSKNSTTSKTVSSLKAKKKYYIRIRTYKTVGGTKHYSSWSPSKSVKTK